jgi:uncharacterized protein YjiK
LSNHRLEAWFTLIPALLFALSACTQQDSVPAADLPGPEEEAAAIIDNATSLPFQRVKDAEEEPLIDFPESSGLAFHPKRKTLFTVSDDGHIGEFRIDGTLVQRRHLLFEDFEGIAVHTGTGLLYVVIEGRDNVLEVDPEGLVIRREYDLARDFRGRKLFTLGGDGLEGIAFVPDHAHPEGGTFFVVNRAAHPKDLEDPPLVIEYELPVSSDSNDELEGQILSYKLLPVTELSGLHYDSRVDRFYAISDDNDLLLELTAEGEIVSSHPLDAEDPEGIAMDSSGMLYIAQDSEGIIQFSRAAAPPAS